MSTAGKTTKKNAWLRGALGAFVSIFVYVIALWVFLTLILLVVSMEAGGSGLSDMALPLAFSVALLSQGSGFETQSFALTIVPLLLTFMLIRLVREMVSRTSKNIKAYCAGILVWLVCTWLLTQNAGPTLVDSLWLILLKAAIVYTLGFVWAALPDSDTMRRVDDQSRKLMPTRLRHMVRSALVTVVFAVLFYCVLGFVVVIVWVVHYYPAMFKVFEFSSMPTGSRIVTTLASLVWLPNLALWALSWLFGGGFAVGDLARFTLWTGRSSGLPAIPFFALFPDGVASQSVRTLLTVMPLAVGIASGLFLMFSHRGFGVGAGDPREHRKIWPMVEQFLYPLGSFTICSVLLVFVFDALFYLSDGSLGRKRLKNVGVDVTGSVQVVVRPTVMGLFVAWIAAVMLVCLVLAARVYVRQIRVWFENRSRIRHSPDQASSRDAVSGTSGPSTGRRAKDVSGASEMTESHILSREDDSDNVHEAVDCGKSESDSPHHGRSEGTKGAAAVRAHINAEQ